MVKMERNDLSARIQKPFAVDNDPFYDEKNMAFLREGIAVLNAGHGEVHKLIEE